MNVLELVSVIVPSYNHGHFVGDAIESIRLQTYRAFEVIVVDDGSTDQTKDVVTAIPWVRYVRQDRRGLAAARNRGLAEALGDFVVFLDADDRLFPAALETNARLMRENPDLGFTAGYSQFITAGGDPLPTQQPVRPEGDPYTALLRRNSIRNPAMVMFRRRVLEEVGGFGSGIDACADYDLYLRISRTYPVRFHTAVVAEYRKHGGNMSGDAALMIRQLRLVMRAQRSHLVTQDHRNAFRAGRSNMYEYYGDRLADQIRDRLRTGAGWVQAVADLATMIRCHPRGVMEHARRRILSVWRGRTTRTHSA